MLSLDQFCTTECHSKERGTVREDEILVDQQQKGQQGETITYQSLSMHTAHHPDLHLVVFSGIYYSHYSPVTQVLCCSNWCRSNSSTNNMTQQNHIGTVQQHSSNHKEVTNCIRLYMQIHVPQQCRIIQQDIGIPCTFLNRGRKS